MILGIDNGLKGGMVLLNDKGHVEAYLSMPTLKEGKRNKYDIESIVWFFRTHKKRIGTVVLETAQAMPGQGVTSTFHIGEHYGMLQGILCSLEIPVVFVRPQQWQRGLFGKKKVEDTKVSSVNFACDNAPDIDWKNGRRVYQDGLTDAYCIAHYHFINR